MDILNAFLQQAKLVQFQGDLTYNSNGFAILPSYTIITIPASMQPLTKKALKFLPEGTHYASYLSVLTNFPVYVDTSDYSLGNYFIYGDYPVVYKITSQQDFFPFGFLPTNQYETLVVKDNRMKFDGTTLNIPFPEINGEYAPLFELITMVNQCFTTPALTTLWGFQQEYRPRFPFCVVTLEAIDNIDNTNFVNLDLATSTLTQSVSNELIVKFSFYAQDMIQCLNMMQQFKLNYVNYQFTTNQFAFIGFVSGENEVLKELYEDRTIFHTEVNMRFSFIVQQQSTSTQSINTVIATLNIPPVLP